MRLSQAVLSGESFMLQWDQLSVLLGAGSRVLDESLVFENTNNITIQEWCWDCESKISDEQLSKSIKTSHLPTA